MDRIDAILDTLKNEYATCISTHNSFMVKFGFLITIEGMYYAEVISKLQFHRQINIVSLVSIVCFISFLLSIYYIFDCFKGCRYGRISLDNFKHDSDIYNREKYTDEQAKKSIILAYTEVILTEKISSKNLQDRFKKSINFLHVSAVLYIMIKLINI